MSVEDLKRRVFDLAYEYRKTKLWKVMDDTQVFAFQFQDGEIDYVSIMGNMGEFIAVGVYPGWDGLDSLREVGRNTDSMSPVAFHEHALCQECVTCAFQRMQELTPREQKDVKQYLQSLKTNKPKDPPFPNFMRFHPRRLPWDVTEEIDFKRLYYGLKAAIEVAGKVHERGPGILYRELRPNPGIINPVPLLIFGEKGISWRSLDPPLERRPIYPSARPSRDQLRKITGRGTEKWIISIFICKQHFVDENEEWLGGISPQPFYPMACVIMDTEEGSVLYLQIAKEDEYVEHFSEGFMNLCAEKGAPETLLICNDRTEKFCARISAALGIRVEREERIPILESFQEDFFDSMRAEFEEDGEYEGEIDETPDDSYDDAYDDSDDDEYDGGDAEYKDHFRAFMHVISDPSSVSDLSDLELLFAALFVQEGDGFSKEVMDRIEEEKKRRNLVFSEELKESYDEDNEDEFEDEYEDEDKVDEYDDETLIALAKVTSDVSHVGELTDDQLLFAGGLLVGNKEIPMSVQSAIAYELGQRGLDLYDDSYQEDDEDENDDPDLDSDHIWELSDGALLHLLTKLIKDNGPEPFLKSCMDELKRRGLGLPE